MDNYSQFWNVLSQSKEPIYRLDRHNYEKTFDDMSDMFSSKGTQVAVFKKGIDYPDGDKVGLFYTTDNSIVKVHSPAGVGHIRMMEIHLDENFLEFIQVNLHERARNSHLVSKYKRDDCSFLYLADDFSADLVKPEEVVFQLYR